MSNKPNFKGSKPLGSVADDAMPTEEQVQGARARQRVEMRGKLDAMWEPVAGDERYKVFADLVMTNMERGEKCRVQGAELDSTSLVSQRVEAVLNHVLPVGTEERLVFELAWQNMIAGSFDAMEAELRRVNLTRNMQVPNGLILPQ